MQKNTRPKALDNASSVEGLEEALQYIKEADVSKHEELKGLLLKKAIRCNPMNRLLNVRVKMDSRSMLEQIKRICLNMQDTPDMDPPSVRRISKTKK